MCCPGSVDVVEDSSLEFNPILETLRCQPREVERSIDATNVVFSLLTWAILNSTGI